MHLIVIGVLMPYVWYRSRWLLESKKQPYRGSSVVWSRTSECGINAPHAHSLTLYRRHVSCGPSTRTWILCRGRELDPPESGRSPPYRRQNSERCSVAGTSRCSVDDHFVDTISCAASARRLRRLLRGKRIPMEMCAG
jgi:hypothetical protein